MRAWSGCAIDYRIGEIQRIQIWGAWVRLAHWLMALAVLLLMLTGWLIDTAPGVAGAASDYHYIFSTVLMAGLALRLWLLFFDKGIGHWQKLLPEANASRTYKQMLVFYLSLGKMTLPGWYAHNPLWKPVYLLLFVVLLLQILTGMNRDVHPLVMGFYLPGIHELLASIITGFFVLHIIAVVLHDLKGTASDISAMINGHKIFVIRKVESQDTPAVYPVSLDQLRSKR